MNRARRSPLSGRPGEPVEAGGLPGGGEAGDPFRDEGDVMSIPRWMDASEAEPDQLYVVNFEHPVCYLDSDDGWTFRGDSVVLMPHVRVYGPIPVDDSGAGDNEAPGSILEALEGVAEARRVATAIDKTVECCPDGLGHVPGPGRPI